MATEYIVEQLNLLAEGLDFYQEDDRVTFRYRVGDAFKHCSVAGLRKYVRDLNEVVGQTANVGQSRAQAMSRLTSTFMLARQLGKL
jgi:hypothetical protein